MKHRIIHALQEYVFHPPVKALLAEGFVSPSCALLEITGRTKRPDERGSLKRRDAS